MKSVRQKDVQRVLTKHKLPSWGKYYGELCKISHLDRDFALEIYPALWVGQPLVEGIVRLMDYYLMWLNVFAVMTLFAVLQQLKPHMGGDFEQLETTYLRLFAKMDADHKIATAIVDQSKHDKTLGLVL